MERCRERYYLRNGWEMEERENIERGKEYREEELIARERESARAEKDSRILEARYNRNYKEILAEGRVPRYLMRVSVEKTNLGEGLRALARLRCGNMEEWNKYWLDEDTRKCMFCNKDRDYMKHYIEEYGKIKEWFNMLGERKENIWKRIWSEDLNERKGELLVRIWKIKEKLKRKKWDRNLEERRVGERKEEEGDNNL